MSRFSRKDIGTMTQEDLEELLEAIFSHSFATLDEIQVNYNNLSPNTLENSINISRKNPNHPLAIPNRAKRMIAAEIIRDISIIYQGVVDQHILDDIHKAMFDGSRAVREALVETIYHIGNCTSIGPLRKLIKQEPFSTTRGKALVALSKFEQQKYTCKQPEKGISLLGNQLDLAEILQRVADEHCVSLKFPSSDMEELLGDNSIVHIIDRTYLGQEKWVSYCTHWNKIDTNLSRNLIIIDTGYDTYCTPETKLDSVFYVGSANLYTIDTLVRELITHGKADMGTIIEETNKKLGRIR